MTTGALSPWRIQLDTSLLTPSSTGDLVVGIKKVAPQSALIQDPAIAASYASILQKNTDLGTFVTAVAEDEKKLHADVTARDGAYNTLLLELLGLKQLVLSKAKSETDITGMGFVLLTAASASRTKPDAPYGLIVKIGKVHGKARVAIPGKIRGRFVAEVSADPIGTWTALPGNGKERKLSGYPTGTKLWVHFAQVRYGLQSDWSAPVLVVIP